MDAVDLARIQFAFTAVFHFIFPAVSIGLGLLIAIAEVVRWRTKSEVWDRLARFWTKVFALTFAVGVASGIVMEFQFGTNWSRYSTFVGDIFGSPLAAEAIFAFFLESTFLGLLLWGRKRMGSGLRAASAVLVAFGAIMSGFWIIVANSWMQTPAGYEVQGDKAVLTDFMAAVFNPSTMPRFTHTIISAWAVASFADGRRRRVVSAQAPPLRRRPAQHPPGPGGRARRVGRHVPDRRLALAPGGEHAAGQVRRHAGLFETTQGAPMIIFALPPSQEGAATAPSIAITSLLSLADPRRLQRHQCRASDSFPQDQWPPVGDVLPELPQLWSCWAR